MAMMEVRMNRLWFGLVTCAVLAGCRAVDLDSVVDLASSDLSGCAQGSHLCNGICKASSSVDSCGTACAPCAPPANSTATCDGTACGFTCDPGYYSNGTACVACT